MRLLRTPEFDGRSVVNEEGGKQVVNVDASLLEQAELERLAVLIAKPPTRGVTSPPPGVGRKSAPSMARGAASGTGNPAGSRSGRPGSKGASASHAGPAPPAALADEADLAYRVGRLLGRYPESRTRAAVALALTGLLAIAVMASQCGALHPSAI